MSENRKQFEKEKAYNIAIINRRGEDYGIDEAITDYDIECEYSLWLKNKNKVLLEALKGMVDSMDRIGIYDYFTVKKARKAIAEEGKI